MEKMTTQGMDSVAPGTLTAQNHSSLHITKRMLFASLAAPSFPTLILAILATPQVNSHYWVGYLVFTAWACSYAGFVILGMPGLFMLQKHHRLTVRNLSIYGAIAGTIPYLGIALISSMNRTFSLDFETIILHSLGTLFGLGIAFIYGMISGIKTH